MPAPDVAVIGAGIVGSATAAFLAEHGLHVRLYEMDRVAAGASGRNSGVVQHPFDPVLAMLHLATLDEYRRLTGASGGTFSLGAEPAGLLSIGLDRTVAEGTAAAWAEAWPATRPEIVDGPTLAALEPSLAPDLVACRLAIGFPMAPSAATEAFAAQARRLGVEVVIGGGSARPTVVDGRAVGVDRGGSVEPAGAVIVAAGPWTPEVVDPGGSWRPIRRSWGVVASLAVPDAPHHVLEAADIDATIEPADGDRPAGPAPSDDAAVDFSLVPADGSSALGSTFLPDEPDHVAWLAALRRVGQRYIPAVADAPLLGLRCCARPVSLDGRPLIGAAPWADGLWIAAGHGPWGISTGPGSARILARVILGDATVAVPPELDARRFGSPGLPPGQRQEFGSNR